MKKSYVVLLLMLIGFTIAEAQLKSNKVEKLLLVVSCQGMMQTMF